MFFRRAWWVHRVIHGSGGLPVEVELEAGVVRRVCLARALTRASYCTCARALVIATNACRICVRAMTSSAVEPDGFGDDAGLEI